MNETLPIHFKLVKIRDYDKNTDPEEPLTQLENMVMLNCYEDRIKCKAFLTILVDSTQVWFEKIRPQSIHSFKNFRIVFLHHFSSSKRYKKTAFNLFQVKKFGDKSLQEFIRRFNKNALEVPSCSPEIKTTAFAQGALGRESFLVSG